ncbi:MAG: RluA family pseudouridine synthase [Bacteriovoracaceae bacterium]|nr:RluA family pseudouridine synthase [Bacteriovoracaceae bacterium]
MNPEIKKSFRADKFVVEFPVTPTDEGLRLDAFMHQHMPTLSREFIKKKIEKGEVTISGRPSPHKSSTKVHTGETVTSITYNTPVLEDEEWQGKPHDLTEEPVVVYEDDKIIACHKPAFMTTHPAGRHLFYVATTYFSTIHDKVIHSIHRLDRETSGLLLLGKDPDAAKLIGQLFENDKVKKCYFLIAHINEGAKKMPYTANERLGENPGLPRGMQRCFPTDSDEGKEAETSFEPILEKEGYMLALAFPKTGRQHQIRLHAAFHGYPLLGDKLYNGDSGIFMRFKDKQATPEDHELMQIPRQALHALALRIPYPDPDKLSLYRAPLGRDLILWIEEKLKIKASEVERLIEEKLKAWTN